MQAIPERRISEARWQVWYQDMFDRECPRQVDTSGVGLIEGLSRLWSRFLRETVQSNGLEGFSRFNLWWEQESRSISINGELSGAVHLKKWTEGKPELLQKIARAHCEFVLRGESSEIILEIAHTARGPEEFRRKLSAWWNSSPAPSFE